MAASLGHHPEGGGGNTGDDPALVWAARRWGSGSPALVGIAGLVIAAALYLAAALFLRMPEVQVIRHLGTRR
jgi:hypothetical protein